MSFKYTIYGLDENMNRVTEVIELDHELSAETLNSFSFVGFPEAQQSEQYFQEFYNEVRYQIEQGAMANFTRANQIWAEYEAAQQHKTLDSYITT